jgi:DNA-binding PucR family transcriptional regulator
MIRSGRRVAEAAEQQRLCLCSLATREHRQQRIILCRGETLGRPGETATPGDLGFLGLLLSDRKDLPGFVASAIGPLRDYDARKNSGLLRTLEAYYETGGSLTKTKAILHVHVNTVTRRLDRITALLGDGWQTGERAPEIRVAIRLHRAGAQHWLGSDGSHRPGPGAAPTTRA